MPLIKFHEKNKALLAKTETTYDTYVAPASTDALPSTEVSGSVTYETGSYQYLGDSLSRDEFNYTKDSYADISVSTPQQILKALNPSLLPDDAPLSRFYQACGAFAVVDAAGNTTYSNTLESNDSLSIDFRKSSPDDATNDKVYQFKGVRGMVDISANLGEVPLNKFSFKGNAILPAVTKAKVNPDVTAQVTSVVKAVRQTTIQQALIARLDGTFSALSGGITVSSITRSGNIATITFSGSVVAQMGAVGNIIALRIGGATDSLYNGDFIATITGTGTTATYFMKGVPSANASGTLTCSRGPVAESFCFATLNAANFFGFDYQRYLTGCEEGFAKGAVATEVSVTFLEDQIGNGSFDPDQNVSNFYGVKLKFGSGTANYVTYMWNKLQISNVKDGKVATYEGRDVTFRNTGNSFIILE